VRNEHHQRVLTVTVSMEIHRVDTETLPPRVKTRRAISHKPQYGIARRRPRIVYRDRGG
jgi:hypothetical protein